MKIFRILIALFLVSLDSIIIIVIVIVILILIIIIIISIVAASFCLPSLTILPPSPEFSTM